MTDGADRARGRWLALVAALLGWMFDGFEMGLFPLVARAAIRDLHTGSGLSEAEVADAVNFYFSMATAAFLVGAAAGGVVFGWLGDKIGRVRAMGLSILTYSVFSGLSGLALTPWHIIFARFLAALGMGGEWSLGVALVMEVWQGQSRAALAGVIGAAANAGYLLVGALSLGLASIKSQLRALGLGQEWVDWRLLLVCGALPAVLTLLIRLFVPESEAWRREKERGMSSSWSATDLFSVLGGVGVCLGLLAVWQAQLDATMSLKPGGLWVGLAATVTALALVGWLYLYPILAFLRRSREPAQSQRILVGRMLFAALISGVPLLATWGSVQWGPSWAGYLARDAASPWRDYTQVASAFGAVLGCVAGAAFAGWAGRRWAYVLLCVLSFGAVLLFYQTNSGLGWWFLVSAGLMGGTTAAFYGWIPLYLPELFPTRVRATGQGFGFNFGRILASVGVLLVPVLIGTGEKADFARGCTYLAGIYLLGVAVIWLGPETRGKPLPE
jgi:MFS family permease